MITEPVTDDCHWDQLADSPAGVGHAGIDVPTSPLLISHSLSLFLLSAIITLSIRAGASVIYLSSLYRPPGGMNLR